jgi:GT2 family glycosyltransferase
MPRTNPPLAWQTYQALDRGEWTHESAQKILRLGWSNILLPEFFAREALPFPHTLLFTRLPSAPVGRPWILHTGSEEERAQALCDPNCIEVTMFRSGCPPKYWDPWLKDPQRLDAGLVEMRADNRPENSPRWSVIIPCFRHQEELQNTLNALAVALNHQSAEIIIVQDIEPGSLPLPPRPELPALWVNVGRKKARTFDDDGFRAGSIRNLGVRLSRGERLLFLDADVLVPSDFFDHFELSADNTLVQAQRWHLADPAFFTRPVEGLSPIWDCTISEGGLWEDFQSRPWHEQPEPWRWVSTFCLSVTRRRFEELGGFRESFDRYGFEDTEFGRRHVQHSGILKRIPVDVFHQYQSRERGSLALQLSETLLDRWREV